ncbi:MAG: prenyltransferase/squalene oxidase repeat-containing protein [Thermoguttaceae bacterium]
MQLVLVVIVVVVKLRENCILFDIDMTYLASWTLKIHAGAVRIAESHRNQIRNFVLSTQSENGGFAGKKGDGDIYYTAFALRTLFILGGTSTDVLERVSLFLSNQTHTFVNAIELTSYLMCHSLLDWIQGTESLLKCDFIQSSWNRFRHSDGCFRTSKHAHYSSTYTTFLAATTFELFGLDNEKNAISTECILSRQRPDGGFVEIEKLHQSGTNPTAAAIGLCSMQAKSLHFPEKTIDFLRKRQVDSGGFQANTRTPVADLLSSCTSLIALIDLNAENTIDKNALRRFLQQMRHITGGYCGGIWDMNPDVEYTFYGLCLESLLAKLDDV